MKYIVQMNTREKVAEALLFLENIFCTTSNGHIKVNILQQTLAEIAGKNNEQVSRQLSDFENQNLIKRVKRENRIFDIYGTQHFINDFGAYEMINENKNSKCLLK